jgi:CheY-like chemotaxis protein
MAQILVVDDDPDLRGLVEFRLRRAGHEVVVAGDGKSALAAVR